MAGARRAIDHPLCLDCSSTTAAPLRFVLQAKDAFVPRGIVETTGSGTTIAHSPWYSEAAFELQGADSLAVVYRIPKDERTDLLAASIDMSFSPLFGFMSGADFGDTFTPLVQRQWPDLYELLVRSQVDDPVGRFLGLLVTASGTQWIVADQVTGADREQIDTDQVLDLVGDALQTFIRAIDFPISLQGSIEILGGPDRLSRRLTAASSVFGALGGLGKTSKDGFELATELGDIVKDAKDLLEGLVALKD